MRQKLNEVEERILSGALKDFERGIVPAFSIPSQNVPKLRTLLRNYPELDRSARMSASIEIVNCVRFDD